ncbi:excitatory amino acid transporter 2-like isoform X2 [Physella acuta]|uniref:excitatory amino acid transporter 2-like isoform X2 n=1 Tax=Physella acuta TaxID=109671 RepID=UPI0027DE3066|nr:excitatory amino acid transporter 2-like isoform X2 [Physella acuta]
MEEIRCLNRGATQKSKPRKDTSRRHRCRKFLTDNAFLLLTCCGIVLGYVVGLLVKMAEPGPDAMIWIGLPGEVYMRMLKVVILPLIVCTVLGGTGSTDPKSCGRVGVVCMLYIILTNALCGILGLLFCYLVQPGSVAATTVKNVALDTKNLQTMDIFADFIRNFFPDNIIGAATQVSQTKYGWKEMTSLVEVNGTLTNVTSKFATKSLSNVGGTNILGLIVVSAAFGVAASMAGDKAKPFIAFFQSGAAVIFKLFDWIKWTTPVGAACLIVHAIASIDDVGSAFSTMGLFVLVVSGGNILLQVLLYTLIYLVFTRRNPFTFLLSVARPWVMVMGPGNSAIALPELIEIGYEKYGIDVRLSSFVLPFCVTLNRDGSCFFITATLLFMAQYASLDLTAGLVFTISILSILSSLAVPNVTSASVVSILIIAESLGIPTTSIGLVLAVEWINDKIRTTTNVVSHFLGVVVTWSVCKKNFRKLDIKDVENELTSTEAL